MAGNKQFRSSIHGFNREDVVQYIEYLTSKNNIAVNQLKSENQTLLSELDALRRQPKADPALEQQCADLEAECAQLRQEIAQLQAKVAHELSNAELEAYRRAERAERDAKARAQQIYRQATAALADATAQVDDAAQEFKALSGKISDHITQLQSTVEQSKQALANAASTMYTICPEQEENQ